MSLLAHSFDLINSLPTDIPDPGPVAPPGFAGPVAVIMGWGDDAARYPLDVLGSSFLLAAMFAAAAWLFARSGAKRAMF